jgi:WD40 repeat protein
MFYSPWQRRFSFVGRFLAVGMLIWIPTLSLSHGSDDWKLSFGDRFSNSGGEAKKCAAFSPDGKLVAICCRDNSIRLWDMTAGRELRRLVGHTRNVTQLQFSPDGKRILSAASQEYPPSSFRIWSVATGEMLFHEKSPPKRTDGIAWHPDGRRFAAMLSHYHSNGAAKGNYVEEWDAQTFKPLRRFISVPTAADRLMYSSDGQRLLVSGIGSSLNLQYCHADAEALTTRFLKEKGRTFRDVQVQTYTDRQATVTNVKEGLAWLQRSCTEQDVAVLLFSGHGVQKERGLYYCTHETNIEGLQYTALNWETVAETLRDTKARQILFLADACHAGAFGDAELAPQRALAETLRDAAGVMFFASSAAREISLEDSRWGHGAFCKAILDGLEGKADTNGDGRISIRELSEYVCREVPVMTNGKQHPEIPDLGRYDPNLILVHCEPIK